VQVRESTGHVAHHAHAGMARQKRIAVASKLEGRMQGSPLSQGIHQARGRPVGAESDELQYVGVLDFCEYSNLPPERPESVFRMCWSRKNRLGRLSYFENKSKHVES
jgi:hypothetical protein